MVTMRSAAVPVDEIAYFELAGRGAALHGEATRPVWLGWAVSIVTIFVLSPVIAMVLVFAVLPALPLALAIGAVLGPSNLIDNGEEAEERAVRRARIVYRRSYVPIAVPAR